MKRFVWRCCFRLFLAVTLLAGLVTTVHAGDQGFRFVHMTDTHIGHAPGHMYTTQMVAELLADDVSFLVHGGDVTETGAPSQYQLFLEMVAPVPVPIYYTPGNHESRWTDAGKSHFRNYLGQPYQAWDYAGVHFVTLDTSVAMGQHGHLDKAMLTWLQNDLAQLADDTPVVIFAHHPIFFDETLDAGKFMDNDWELWPIIKDYNVVAIFSGHGHINLKWVMNGVPCFMTKAAMEGGYVYVDVDLANQELRIFKRIMTTDTTELMAQVPLTKPTGQRGIRIVEPGAVTDSFLLRAELVNWQEPERVEYKLEDYSWKPLEWSDGYYQKEIDLTGIEDGNRTFWVRAVDGDGDVFLDQIVVRVNQTDQVQEVWRFAANGGIQHAPVVEAGKLYFGDNSGCLYQVDQASGKKGWEFTTGGAVIGAPVLAKGRIWAGSADGKVYCLSATSGNKVWEYQSGGAIVGSPLLVDNTIYVGSTDFNMYALDAQTGQELWRFPTGNAITAKAAYGKGKVFFGSWDGCFYAVQARDGSELWQRQLGSQVYYAPAASAPLYQDGRVFISTPGNRVYALDGASGELLWQVSASSGLATPILFNHALIYNTAGGDVYALDPATGENVWQVNALTSAYMSRLTPHGGDLLLNGVQRKLTSVNLLRGEEDINWFYTLSDSYLYNSGTADGEVIFVGTMAGELLALRAKPGEEPGIFPRMAAFPDVIDHWARLELNDLARLGLVNGFEDGTFRPDQPMTRAQIAQVLSRYLQYEQPTDDFQSAFADVDGHWAALAIAAMHEQGVVGGYVEQGQAVFKPERHLTRAEAVTMLARTAGLEAASSDYSSELADIAGHWAEGPIKAMAQAGLVTGYASDGEMVFLPDQEISRAELGVLLVRLVKWAE